MGEGGGGRTEGTEEGEGRRGMANQPGDGRLKVF